LIVKREFPVAAGKGRPSSEGIALPLITSPAPPLSAKLVPGGVQSDDRTPVCISYTLRVEQDSAGIRL
jgi:hypothetical protein